MQRSIPQQMKAVAIERFGGPEVLQTETLPVPKPREHEVLIRVETAGIGVWDPWVREGGFDRGNARFPWVLGNDGAGEVVAVGSKVRRFQVGDLVYAYGMPGGFQSEYAAVREDDAALIPRGVKTEEAGALGADGITALEGLEDHLHLRAGQSLMILGASGGIGHIAVQLAKRIGARVLAVASGPDGVDLVRRLGADAAVDGRREDVVQAARDFAPAGLDAVLALAGGPKLDEALKTVKKGGRIAFPNGVEPEPQAPKDIARIAYDGVPRPDAFERLNRLIGDGPFHVELGRVYRPEEIGRAHRELEQHHLGKLALRLH